MKIRIDELPPVKSKDDIVAIDTEWFKHEKMHRPGGVFACLQIFDGDNAYVITNQDLVEPAVKRVWDAEWVFHNAIYDIRQLRQLTDIPERKISDIMIIEQCLWSGYYGFIGKDSPFSLKAMTRRYLDTVIDKDTREEFVKGNQLTRQMIQYAAQDVMYTYIVYQLQQKYDWWRKIYPLEIDTLWAVLDMKPIRIDVKKWRDLVEQCERLGNEIEREIGINVYSPAQVRTWVQKKIGINLPDTQAETLEAYQNIPEIKKILDARTYRKIPQNWGEEWLLQLENDEYVYPDWHPMGAESGRFSCSSPNMQQIPARKIPEFRKLIIPKKGNKIIVADIEQQEPRILAYVSGDRKLKEAFIKGEDIHLMVTRLIYKDPTIKKDDPRRARGKGINLGTVYGLTPQGLAKRTGLALEEAQTLMRNYFNEFYGVEKYMRESRQFAGEHDYVETPAGRRIWINPYQKSAENNAVNFPIQGGGADFTKAWLVTTRRKCREQNLPFDMIMQVHDEIVFDVPEQNVEAVKNIIHESMLEVSESMFPGVPFKAEIKVGDTWAVK